MATREILLRDALSPDPTNASAPFWQPASILDANDLHDGLQVLVFPDGSTKIGAMVEFELPTNYVGTPTFVIRWKSAATTGDVVWDVDYNTIGVGETGDPSAYTESLTVTDTVAGTARLDSEVSVAATAGNFAVGDRVLITLSRDLVDSNDTMADEAELIGFKLTFTDI